MFRYSKKTLVLEILTILGAVVMLMPFYFLITTSLKTGPEVLSGSALALPTSPTFANFVTLLSPSSDASGAILNGLLYSLIITAGTIIGLIVVGSPAAYVLTRSTSRWSNRTYYLFLIAILLPTQLGVDLAEHPFGDVRTGLQVVLPVHQHLWFDDGRQPGLLGERCVAGELVGVGLDARVRG